MKQMAEEYDFLFKLALVGDSGVGKTCVLTRYAEDAFKSTFIPTLGELSCFHTCNYRQIVFGIAQNI